MSKLKQLMRRTWSTTPTILSSRLFTPDNNHLLLPPIHLAQLTSTRFLDIYQIGNKAAIEKERARLSDEMNRGYFADINEFKQHGGKMQEIYDISMPRTDATFQLFLKLSLKDMNPTSLTYKKMGNLIYIHEMPLHSLPIGFELDAFTIAAANKVVIPAVTAVKFPALEVSYSDGRIMKMPITSATNDVDTNNLPIPKVSLLCLSFRANSQEMINSWSVPFLDAFSDSKDIHMYEVSFIDSWLLSWSPIKRLLLRIMRKPNPNGRTDVLQRQIVYSFGDNCYFRKELKILNLLTGYIFLLDKFGRIRWQGFGLATEEELSSLLTCTSVLLEEK